MKKPYPVIQVGVLGGGQLARMLALRAHCLGINVHVLSADPRDPAAQVVRHWHQGDPGDQATLKRFLKQVDIATFESEFMDAQTLGTLSRELQTPIYPRPAHMHLIQDRWTQKQLLKKHGLPTAPFFKVTTFTDAERALAEFSGRMVLKKRRFGYDGYGTFVIRSAEDLAAARTHIENDRYGFIAEAFIPFRRECALMVARSKSGQSLALPVVETYQENSRCLWVKGPVESTATKRLSKQALRFVEKLNYVGVMGIEVFDTGKELIINELAPRVHNSGHYSLDALEEDQFTLHIKAILDLPFAPVRQKSPGFAMWNLLGDAKAADREMKWEIPPGVHLHWYGKHENRAGRKMGHLNALGKTSEQALKALREARRFFQV